MVDKQKYLEDLITIKEMHLISMVEMASQLGISYTTLKKILDVDDKTPLRELTARKIKAFINLYIKKDDYGR